MSFEDFLKMDIVDDNGNKVGYFSYENEKVYVNGLGKKMEFPLCFNPEYIPFYIPLAYHKLYFG